MEIKHSKLGKWKVVDELTQPQVEKLFSTHNALPADQSPVVSNRVMVEAAIEAGLFTEEIDTEALKPAAFVFLAGKIMNMAVDAITIPEDEAKN